MSDDDLYYDEPDNSITEWVWILVYDTKHPLTRYCIAVATVAVLAWLLIQSLTP